MDGDIRDDNDRGDSHTAMENDDLYKLTFETNNKYLNVFATGDLSNPTVRIGAWKKITAECRDLGQNTLLVIQDAVGNKTATDAYVSSQGIVELGLQGLQIAFVDLNRVYFENNQLGELMANNRGAFAKVFTTEADALDWLNA